MLTSTLFIMLPCMFSHVRIVSKFGTTNGTLVWSFSSVYSPVFGHITLLLEASATNITLVFAIYG